MPFSVATPDIGMAPMANSWLYRRQHVYGGEEENRCSHIHIENRARILVAAQKNMAKVQMGNQHALPPTSSALPLKEEQGRNHCAKI